MLQTLFLLCASGLRCVAAVPVPPVGVGRARPLRAARQLGVQPGPNPDHRSDIATHGVMPGGLSHVGDQKLFSPVPGDSSQTKARGAYASPLATRCPTRGR